MCVCVCVCVCKHRVGRPMWTDITPGSRLNHLSKSMNY